MLLNRTNHSETQRFSFFVSNSGNIASKSFGKLLFPAKISFFRLNAILPAAESAVEKCSPQLHIQVLSLALTQNQKLTK